jgi:hypothetical protein
MQSSRLDILRIGAATDPEPLNSIADQIGIHPTTTSPRHLAFVSLETVLHLLAPQLARQEE